MRRIDPRTRFQSDTVPSLNVPELEALPRARAPGHVTYADPANGTLRAVAFAPLRESPWVVAVDQDARESSGPLGVLAWREGLALALVAGLLAAGALLWARRALRMGTAGSTASAPAPGEG